MIDGAVVVDGVVHGYYAPPETYTHPISGHVVESLYGYHQVFSPRGDRRWLLDRDRFDRVDAGLLGSAVFKESQTDFCVYHDIPLYGLYEGGASPLRIGRELRERHPDRVALFGGIWPSHEDPIGEVDRLIEEEGVVGLKFYPSVSSSRIAAWPPAALHAPPSSDPAAHHDRRAPAAATNRSTDR